MIWVSGREGVCRGRRVRGGDGESSPPILTRPDSLSGLMPSICCPLTSSLFSSMPGLSGTITIQFIFPGAAVAMVLIRGAMLVLVAIRGIFARYRPAVTDLMDRYKREGVISGG